MKLLALAGLVAVCLVPGIAAADTGADIEIEPRRVSRRLGYVNTASSAEAAWRL
jgi:hypothetical protein